MGGEIRKIVICQLGALAVGKPVCKGASNQALKHNVPIIISKYRATICKTVSIGSYSSVARADVQ